MPIVNVSMMNQSTNATFPETPEDIKLFNQSIYILTITNKIYRSRDFGNTWELIYPMSQSFQISHINVVSDNLIVAVPDAKTSIWARFIENVNGTWGQYSVSVVNKNIIDIVSVDYSTHYFLNVHQTIATLSDVREITYLGSGQKTIHPKIQGKTNPTKLMYARGSLFITPINQIHRYDAQAGFWYNKTSPNEAIITYCSDEVVVSGSTTTLWVSYDNGDSYSHKIPIDFSQHPFKDISFNGSIGVIVCSNATFVSYDVGRTWIQYDQSGGEEINK